MLNYDQQIVIGIVLSICFTSSAMLTAQTHIWTGTGTGGDGISWHDGDNWNQNAAPIAGSEVSIANDSVVVYMGEDAAWVHLENAKLTVLGKLQLNNGDTFAIFADNSHILNPGVVIIEEAGQDQFGDRAIELTSGSTFQNDSTCRILTSDGNGIRIEGASSYTNNGYLSVVSDLWGITTHTLSSFTNNDSLVVNSGSTGIWLSSNSVVVNHGFIDIEAANAVAGLRISNGAKFDNYGQIHVQTTDIQDGILCSSSQSELNHHMGEIVISSTGASNIVRCSSNALFTIATGASLEMSGSTSTNLLNIENTATVCWNGIVTINN